MSDPKKNMENTSPIKGHVKKLSIDVLDHKVFLQPVLQTQII